MRLARWLAGAAFVVFLVAFVVERAARRHVAGAAAAPAFRSSCFKITFGLKRRFPNTPCSGGFRDAAQIRSLRGWHLSASDSIRPPTRWDITLQPAGRDITPKGVIAELLSPEEQPVRFYTRQGDFSFVPAEIPYGKTYLVPGTGDDVSVERVPSFTPLGGAGYEDDDPALCKRRDGSYWLAWVAYRTRSRDGYFIDGADEVMVARSPDGRSWSRPQSLTPPGDHFRVALAEDGSGRLWCVYSQQKEMESGNFDLYARSYDGSHWSAEQRLTSSPLPDVFHRLAAAPNGSLFLVWMGFRPGAAGAAPQSDILMRVLGATGWGEELRLSDPTVDDWEPAVAVGPDNQAWVVWDSYRSSSGTAEGGNATAGYDLMLRNYSDGKLGALRAVSETPFAEMRADVAVDGAGRVWLAWEEGGVHWGKDTGYENPKQRIRLRKGGSLLYGPNDNPKAHYRRPRVAVLENGQLRQPAASIEKATPDFLAAYLWQNPRLGVDAAGKIWLFLRHQTVARGRFAGHLFDSYATTLVGEDRSQAWMTPVLLPGSTGRQDTVLATAPSHQHGLIAAVVTDGRRLPVALPENHDLTCVTLDLSHGSTSPGISTRPALTAFVPSTAPDRPVPHPNESADVERVRKYRVTVAGQTYKIVRGDLHRHTEISMDGAIDGSLWDLYRYALNAAAFDFIAVTDHNYGAWLDTDEPESPNTDDIYQWWRTQKSADIFHVPGRFIPLYGYERSINFPLGHRNIFHDRRGVMSYRVPKLNISERPEFIEKDAQGLWAYLRSTGGIGIPHTTGTTMGTDWRLRDDEVIPVTEIYQGDRNNYEEEGAPRAASQNSTGPGSAGQPPFQKGLVWNALGAGYRMGFIASSDHYSTHISYANILVPDRQTTRSDIQQAFRQRHTYASTDNIVVDFHTAGALQGDVIETAENPVFQVRVLGTEPLLRVEVIHNNRVLYTRAPDASASDPRNFSFSFQATGESTMAPTSQVKNWNAPETGIRPRPKHPESYYYIRVLQSFSEAERGVEGEIAWSSPIFVVAPR